MCLILFARDAHPEYPLIVAANRDEFYARPTAAAHWWRDTPDVLAGRDLQGGGTWMGVNRRGDFAALTNYREPERILTDAPSRGALVADFLRDERSASDYLNDIHAGTNAYNGFNLLVGRGTELYYFSNRGAAPQLVPPGLHGLSNHLLNTPWPKVEKGKVGLAQVLQASVFDREQIFQLLLNAERAPDATLPATGVSLEWERRLSPLFIQSEQYGTRLSTLLTIDRRGEIYLEERSYVPEKVITTETFEVQI